MLSLKQIHLNIKDLNKIAVPLIIQSMTGIIITLTDQAMVGRISVEAYNSVGVVGSLLSLIAGIIGFISVQFNITGGKALGRKDETDFNDEFASSIVLSVIIGIIFFFLIILFKKPILMAIYGFKGEILNIAIDYSNIMSVYILIQLLLFSFNSFFKIHKNTKWILVGSLTASLLNLVLDYFFIFGAFGLPKLGVRAAAASSIISILVNLSIYIFVCRNEIIISIKRYNIYKVKMLTTIKSSLPLMGQEVLEGSIFSVAINAIVARIGEYELSADLILTQIIGLVLMPMYMYGSAILTLISRVDGMQEKKDLRLLPKIGVMLSSFIYIIISIFFYLFRNLIPLIITDNADVMGITSSLLFFMVIAHLFEPASVVYKYSLQALGYAKYILFQTAKINLIVIALFILTTYVFKTRMLGVFICLFLNYFAVAVIYYCKYKNTIKTY